MTDKTQDGVRFGNEPWDFDPYANMSDDQIGAVVDRLESHRMVPISIRFSRATLDQAKAEGERRGVPYQTLIRTLVEGGLRALAAAPNGGPSEIVGEEVALHIPAPEPLDLGPEGLGLGDLGDQSDLAAKVGRRLRQDR